MRQRTEALVAFAVVGALAVAAALAGRSRAPAAESERLGKPSTFLTEPGGARGLLEALQRLGIEAQRFRDRPKELTRLAGRPRQLLAVIDPADEVSAPDVMLIARFLRSADLLLAGPGAGQVMRCFGYKLDQHFLDSARVTGMGTRAPWVGASLVATSEKVHVDSSRIADVGLLSCRVPAWHSTTTLLRSTFGPAVIRLEGDSGRQVILVSDARLLTNRALRDTDAGPFVLGLFAGRYDHVIFDEYHHGYGASGSLAAATLAWSLHSPWGWVAWQLGAVGLLALLAGAIRFGPAVPGISRTRRSPLEHVRALATALASARGHDEAIAAMVRGLRRRLASPARRPRGDWRSWLAGRTRAGASPAEREALATLTDLVRPGQPASSVLRAADAVEDLWQSLQH